MKKFVVRYTKRSLFRKGAVSTFEETFDHAVDAWRWAKRRKELDTADGRWPILSLEIVRQ